VRKLFLCQLPKKVGLIFLVVATAEQAIATCRGIVLDAAYQRHPERFVRKPPVPPELPTATWINKPDTKEVTH